MLKRLARLLGLNRSCGEEQPWISGTARDRTTSEPGRLLPVPRVMQPTAGQLAGTELPDFPGYLAVEVTNACNLRCTHCNYRFGLAHYTRERGFMSRATLERVLREAQAHHAQVLMNYDGEPLMHRDYLAYLEFATQLGLNTYFNTNGTLFNRAFSERLVSFYKGSIFFSVDGNKEWLERIRVPAQYDQVVGNLRDFLAVNEKAGWPITVGVSLCNLGQTAEERKAFLDEWLPRVNYVSMGEVNDKFGAMISIPMTEMKVSARPICVVPWQTLGVCHNGDVIPCSIYVTRANTADAIFGNVHRNTLQEIWRSEAFGRFRRMVADERYAQSYCDKCQRWLSQFSFPDEEAGGVKIRRNGYWTTFQNLEKGKLNFQGA